MVMIQGRRDHILQQQEINSNLILLKNENTRVIGDMQQEHQEEIDDLETQKTIGLQTLASDHNQRLSQITANNQEQ